MSDLVLLGRAQMRRIEPFFPALARPCPRRRPPGDKRHRLRHPQRAAVEGRATRLRPAQDTLQPLCPLEPVGGVHPHLCRACAADGVPERLMIDATHLKAHRTAASLAQKGVLLVVSAAPKAA